MPETANATAGHAGEEGALFSVEGFGM